MAPPVDRLFLLPALADDRIYVVSSNFDLRYTAGTVAASVLGGTV